ncbi:MAG TPA: hypothetical protein VG942_04860 [Hyphomonadaceae bacterium]|nr:hypothetical protein [Hyphomonadaceae bacterium]
MVPAGRPRRIDKTVNLLDHRIDHMLGLVKALAKLSDGFTDNGRPMYAKAPTPEHH